MCGSFSVKKYQKKHLCRHDKNYYYFCKSNIPIREIVGFFKFIGKIQQLVRKRSQKNIHEVILHYISLPIYPLYFPEFCPIQK